MSLPIAADGRSSSCPCFFAGTCCRGLRSCSSRRAFPRTALGTVLGPTGERSAFLASMEVCVPHHRLSWLLRLLPDFSLGDGVTVAQQILVLFVQVRIL